MIFFGHLGITTGIVKTYEKLVYKNEVLNDKNPIDYRIVFIGAILPDLIDKPIGAYFFRSTFHNSRIFSHSLLFSVVILLIGSYFFYKHKKNNILVLGMSTSMHLLLDSMWLYKGILLWPYYGWRFPERPEGNWAQSSIDRLITDPSYFVPELLGLAIILHYFIKLFKSKGIKDFIKAGMIK